MTAGEDFCCCWLLRRHWDCPWAGVVDSCGCLWASVVDSFCCLWAGVVDNCGCLWAGVVERSLGRVDCEAACCGWKGLFLPMARKIAPLPATHSLQRRSYCLFLRYRHERYSVACFEEKIANPRREFSPFRR